MVVSQDMPPHTGATRRWTAALQLDGQAVLTDSGGTLPKASYEDLLGWVAAGELTEGRRTLLSSYRRGVGWPAAKDSLPHEGGQEAVLPQRLPRYANASYGSKRE